MKPVIHGDPATWLSVIWAALHGYREDCISEGVDNNDEQWDEICTAMAWVHEELGVSYEDLED